MKEQSGLSLPREERSVPFPKTRLSLHDPYVPPGCLLPTPLAAQTPPRRVLPDHLPQGVRGPHEHFEPPGAAGSSLEAAGAPWNEGLRDLGGLSVTVRGL